MNRVYTCVCLALILTLAGCGRSTPLSPDDILSIRILPQDPQLYLEQSVQLVIEGHRADGSVVDLTNEPDLIFRLNEEGIINVLAGGKVQALHAGSVRLMASFGGKEDTVTVTVLYALLEGIEVSPEVLQLEVTAEGKESAQLEVTGNLSDGSTLDLTDSATGTVYATGDQSVATVTTEGLVFAYKLGQTEITVTHGEHQATAIVNVGELLFIEVSPRQAGLEVSETTQLQVYGTYRDGEQELTEPLTGHQKTSYTSSDTSVAAVEPGGLVTGVGSGEATVTVTHRDMSAASLIVVTGTSELIGIEVTPCPARTSLGGWIQLSVWADYSDGSRLEVTPTAGYIVSDEQVATVDAQGLLAAAGAGQATVTASYGGFEDTCRVTVEDRILVSIDLLPDAAGLMVGETLPLLVMGNFNDGSQDDLTGSFMGTTYASTAPFVVTVSPDGVLTALSAGEAVIEATNSGLTDSSTVNVIGPDLISIEVEPDLLQLSTGDSANLVVWANYSDLTRRDVTADATYRSSDTSIARVSAGGAVTAVSGPGEATVTASYGSYTDDCRVMVGSELLFIDVLPPSAQLDISESLQLTVMAFYSDGSTSEVTLLAAFDSSDPLVAAVGDSGLVLAGREGTAVITATYQTLSDTAQIRVNPPVFESIEVEPDMVTLPVGYTQQLTVWANYSDGSRLDVTTDATYLPPENGVVSVSPGGLVTALMEGDAPILVSYLGEFDTCHVIVTSNLVAVEVNPSSALLDPGDTQQLRVTAYFLDGSIADVTGSSIYSTSNSTVASADTSGLVSALAPGNATITAAYGGLSDTCRVYVQDIPTPILVEVFPANLAMNIDDTVNLFVRATYSDGSTENVTLQAGYDSSDPLVASVDSNGKVTAKSGGTATITAAFGGLSDTCQVRVNAPMLVSIDVEPESANLNVNDSLQLTVWANYSDGARVDVTASAAYASSDPLVADVQAGGLVTALAEGTAVITATYQTLTDTCDVNVQQQSPQPTLDTVTPDQVLAGSGDTIVTLDGTGFITTSTALLDSMNLATTFISATQLTAVVPAAEIVGVGAHLVAVYNSPPGGGLSNTRPFYAVEAPAVTTLSPDSGLQGTVVRVVFYGNGLLGCSVNPQNPGIGVSGVSYSDDGTQLSATFIIGSAAPPGTDPVTLTNAAGSTTVSFIVIEYQPLDDLVIGPGEVVYLEGVQSYHNIVIGTGATVYGTGTVPLQFLATGDVTVRGEIHVSGHSGEDGYYDPAGGGAAGPGGSGGGGGADGDAATGGLGGDGSPPGQDAAAGQGAGTPSGAGGGSGAGSGISGGCGQAGGGGGFGGDGGAGGGDAGVGSGGPGGLANTDGSDYNGGTGGGGGSCCGSNCGGGGGGGGGVLVISAVSGGSIVIDGALSADGGNGGDGFTGTGGGGGGTGGRIVITTEGGQIAVNDTVSVHGGDGGRADAGDGGGGGGGGRIIVDAGSGSVDDNFGYYDVRGGASGASRDNGYDGLPGSPGLADVRP